MEMALIPRFTLILSHPVYSASVVLATILVLAGFGSLVIRRVEARTGKALWISFSIILLWTLFLILTGDRLFNMALGWSFQHRLVFSILTISVLSFFLGWPFPSGLLALSKRHQSLIPWAWGINGCASVTGAVLGKIIAMSLGFNSLLFLACVMYFFAVLIFYLLLQDPGRVRSSIIT